ncbi:MAG: tetratricopeptide repeat protein [Treponema sp.]|nr:tetratricopeptide repeat protein [Treponema sp.]
MKKAFFLPVIMLVLAFPLAAQEAGLTPFVTQIKVEPRNNLIRLTWVDSPDAQGNVYIFRSPRPFSGTLPPNARPVVREYGVQQYIDDADDMESIHYFIAASGLDGRRFDIIIPNTNTTGIINGEPLVAVPPPVSVPGTIPVNATGILNLRAELEKDMAVIVWDITGEAKNTALYRSTQQIRQPQDLINAYLVQSDVSSPFVDFPVPGLTWYYAVVFEDDISTGNIRIVPGRNATTAAVVIDGSDTLGIPRPIPLPFMTARNAAPDNALISDIPEHLPLRAEAAEIIKKTNVQPKTPLKLKNPRVFAVDLSEPSGGEESALVQIVDVYFQNRDWENARFELESYLSLPRSKDVEVRARFYLGQIYYFYGNYREALLEFLSVQSIHPVEAAIWIDAVLTAMVY